MNNDQFDLLSLEDSNSNCDGMQRSKSISGIENYGLPIHSRYCNYN